MVTVSVMGGRQGPAEQPAELTGMIVQTPVGALQPGSLAAGDGEVNLICSPVGIGLLDGRP